MNIREEFIKHLRAKCLDSEIEIGDNTYIQEDLGLDSLDMIEIAIDLEESYGKLVSIDENEFWSKRMVGDAVKYLETVLSDA